MQLIDRVPARLAGLLAVGADPGDDEDLKTNKATLILFSAIVAVLASIWVIVYFAVGRPLSASIPLFYQFASVAVVVGMAKTRRFAELRFFQLFVILLLPFLLQWSLGGYAQGSAVLLWALGTPVFASMVGTRPTPWLAAFAVLTVISGLAESWVSGRVDAPSQTMISTFFVLNSFGAGLSFFLGILYFNREQARGRAALAAEQEKSETLLLNILPAAIVERLKSGEDVIADAHPAVTVMFVDIVGFTSTTADMEPADVALALDDYFSALDDLVDEYGLEKIKTIGDGYQVVAGAPEPREDHAAAIADMAVAVRDEIAGRPFGGRSLRVRMGIDTGPVVAAVIGKRKFSYDMWGDVVNTASRMESHGVPDQIQVTERVYTALRGEFDLEDRGTVDVKGKGPMQTYLLKTRRPVAVSPN